MRYTILCTLALAKIIREVTAKKTNVRTESTVGVALTVMQNGIAIQADSLIKSPPVESLSLQQKFYAVLGPVAWKDYFTAVATPARQFRASYILFDALYQASASDDDNLTPFHAFFYAMFAITLLNITTSFFYLTLHRYNNIQYKVTNADYLTEFLETAAAIVGIGSLIQDPSQIGTVSLQAQWTLLAFALGLGCTQMITGIRDKPFFLSTAHSMIEAFAKPCDLTRPVMGIERFGYGLLRTLHTTHALTLAFSLSDALNELFQANSYLNNSLNTLICASPVAFLNLVTARLVVYSLYLKKKPEWALKVAIFDRFLYALNNAFFAFNAFAYFITIDRLIIEDRSTSSYIYNSLFQALSVFLPSFLISISVFITAWAEYKRNFYDKLSIDVQDCGYKREESDQVLDEFYIHRSNKNISKITPSAANQFHQDPDEKEINILMALTGPLELRDMSQVSFWRPEEEYRDSWQASKVLSFQA